MQYLVIYDGNCNLCSTLVQQLERWEKGQIFRYAPMQDQATLQRYSLTQEDCDRGMIVINLKNSKERWQGANAAEKIALLLPPARPFIQLYQSIPGLKAFGDAAYGQIRDHRYDWFGKRSKTYWSSIVPESQVDLEGLSAIATAAEQCDNTCLTSNDGMYGPPQ